MARQAHLKASLVATAFASSAFTFSDESRAADCSADAPFLSQEYLLNKSDCAVDKVLDAGKGMLQEAGMSVVKSLLNFYAPGVSSFLFGGGGDPFAASAAMIVNEIREAKFEIMQAIVNQAIVTDAAYWDSITNRAMDWANPFFDTQSKIDSIDSLTALIADLTTLRNKFETTNYNVWNLHAYVVTVQLEMSLKADEAALRALAQGQRNGETQEQILANTAGAIQTVWTNMLLGPGQVFDYVNGVDFTDFKDTSSSRFVDVKNNTPFKVWPWERFLCDYQNAWKTYAIKASANPVVSSAKRAYEISLRTVYCGNPNLASSTVLNAFSYAYLLTGSAMNHNHFAAGAPSGSLWWLDVGKTDWTRMYYGQGEYSYEAHSNVRTGMNRAYTKHQEDEAELYFLAGYGSVRPILDRWSVAIGRSLFPQSQGLDERLTADIRALMPGFADEVAALEEHFWDRSVPFGLGSDDARRTENFALALGREELALLVDTTSIDTLFASVEKYREYLANTVGSVEAAADQSANFAAKATAITVL